MKKQKAMQAKLRSNSKAGNLSQEVLSEIQNFLGLPLPVHIQEGLTGHSIIKKADQNMIMDTIDFTPPFLRTEKIMIFGNKDDFINSRSLGIGRLTLQDTEGHYNNSVFLAFCGRLMGQSASSHLALLYPNTSPQVVKVDHIEPITSTDTIWKPNKNGSMFFVETDLLKKRLQVTKVNSRISFGGLVFGIADDATIVLSPKDSINSAKELPT